MNKSRDKEPLRHRIAHYALILFSTCLIMLSPPALRPVHAPNPPGRVETTSGIRTVYLQGKPYEMGLQQGVLLRKELRQLVQNYLYDYLILEQGVAHFWLLAYARIADQDIPNDLRAEMQGIADGAGLPYQDILLLNTIPDLLALADQLPVWESSLLRLAAMQQSNAEWNAASGMFWGAWGKATIDGELLLGYNLDHSESDLFSPYLLTVVRQPAFGNAFFSVGVMGMVGVWAGMNEEKIAVALSSSPAVGTAMRGQPLPFLLRQVLQHAGNLDEAVNTLLAAPRSTGGNVLLGDGKAPNAIVLELSTHHYAIFESSGEEGLLARTNHFIDPELALLQEETPTVQEKKPSKTRLEQIQAQLHFNHGWIGMEKALTFLQEDRETTSQNMPGAPVIPFYSALFCPGRLTVWIAYNGKAPKPYTLLNLREALLGHGHR